MKLSAEIRLEKGIELCREIQRRLNDIIREQGSVLHDDTRIWDEFLCKLTNEDWELIFEVLSELEDHMKPRQIEQIMESMAYYRKHKAKPRCMDRNRNYKKPAWMAIMVTREVFNSIDGIWLPNRSEKATITSVKEKRFASVFE